MLVLIVMVQNPNTAVEKIIFSQIACNFFLLVLQGLLLGRQLAVASAALARMSRKKFF